MILRISVLALAGLLASCAKTEPSDLSEWSGRTLYPPEACWRVYAKAQDNPSPEYWQIRRWCDRREMQSDRFL